VPKVVEANMGNAREFYRLRETLLKIHNSVSNLPAAWEDKSGLSPLGETCHRGISRRTQWDKALAIQSTSQLTQHD
jgi:hypothetical protein